MSFALNEVEATAKRATRGAGYCWGIAEEAGKATRWLCAHSMDGVGALARLLERDYAATVDIHTPKGLRDVWTGDQQLCPLMTGASLSDCAGLLQTGPICIQQICVPLLLLPFAANGARSQDTVFTLTIDGSLAITDGISVSMQKECPDEAEHVVVSLGGAISDRQPCLTRAAPRPADWDTLLRYSHRTYAPATEQSRLLGAGAGLSDND